MNKRITLFLLLLTSLYTSLFSQVTISQTKNFTGNPGYIKDLLYNKFDPTLGALTSIQIIFNPQQAAILVLITTVLLLLPQQWN